MMYNFNEAIQKIKAKGANHVRVVPMIGQPVNDGDYQIELFDKDKNAWSPIVSGLKKRMAEDLVGQAINKVILG